MTQNEIENAVAEITGEDIHVIVHRGYNLFDPFDTDFDPEPDDRPPLVLDWDQVDIDRRDIESLHLLIQPRA